jgi:hypothetical protein
MIAENQIVIGAVFLWTGFVCAISFMEAWLKFRARGITVALGLGIGKIVFRALNRMEWLFALLIGLCIFMSPPIEDQSKLIYFIIPFILLILQSFWLLPIMNSRATKYINGETLAPSHLHFYFVGMELVKVASLLILGFSLFHHIGMP